MNIDANEYVIELERQLARAMVINQLLDKRIKELEANGAEPRTGEINVNE